MTKCPLNFLTFSGIAMKGQRVVSTNTLPQGITNFEKQFDRIGKVLGNNNKRGGEKKKETARYSLVG